MVIRATEEKLSGEGVQGGEGVILNHWLGQGLEKMTFKHRFEAGEG